VKSIRLPLASAITIAALFFLMAPQPALAYIDPGSGSLILQVIIATFLSGVVLVKVYWRRLRALITGKPAETENEDHDD
jgi:hypothetical protein